MNEITTLTGAYISFNPCCYDTRGPETALVLHTILRKYLILEGDHRAAYEGKTLEQCKAVFARLAGKHIAPTSDVL
jgi:hypothetical protein